MTNRNTTAAAWARRSSTWSRDSSADDWSAFRCSPTSRGPAPAFASSSTSSSSSSLRAELPARAPHAEGSARVFAFPRVNAPYRDVEGSSELEIGADLLRDIAVLLVEDDFIVAFDMQTLLEEHGALVIGPSA